MADFSTFRRQAPLAVVFNFIKKIEKELRSTIPIILILSVGKLPDVFLYLYIAIYLIFNILYAYFSYKNFQYRIDLSLQEFQLKQGVFSVKEIFIPIQKIQSVQLEQTFILKLLQLYTLKIDTAGSNSDDVQIKAIRWEDAQDLQAALSVGNREDKSFTDEKSPTDHISLKNILLSSIFSNHLRTFFIMLGLVFALLNRFNEYFQQEEWLEKSIQWLKIHPLPLWNLVYAFIAGLFLTLLFTIVRNVLIYFPTTFIYHPQYWGIEYGMIQNKKLLLIPNRVQIFTYSNNFLDKKFGLNRIHFTQINVSNKSGVSRVRLPAIPNSMLDTLREFLGFSAQQRFLTQPYAQIMIIYFMQNFIYLFLSAAFLYYFTAKESMGFFYISFAGMVLFLGILSFFSFKNTQYRFTENSIYEKKGVFKISVSEAKFQSVQSIRIKQKIWNKRNGKMSVQFQTAGGNLQWHYVSKELIDPQINYILFLIEK